MGQELLEIRPLYFMSEQHLYVPGATGRERVEGKKEDC